VARLSKEMGRKKVEAEELSPNVRKHSDAVRSVPSEQTTKAFLAKHRHQRRPKAGVLPLNALVPRNVLNLVQDLDPLQR
jgi:hypothetical protein